MSKNHLLIGFGCFLAILFLPEYTVHGKSLIFDRNARSPVILVPGDGGTQMEAKLDKPAVVHFFCSQKTDWFPIWLNLELITPLTIDCLVDNLRLVYDNKTHTTSNAPGVKMRIVNFGNTTSVEYLDSSQLSVTAYFYPIVQILVKKGYKRGISVRAAPYDFRKAANELSQYYKDLKDLVENTYTLNGNQPVTIIAHSMGNIVTLYFLNTMTQTWKDKYIKRFVTMGAPWGGAMKTMKVVASGDNLGVFVVRTIRARIEQRTMPSTTWMMPSPTLWQPHEVLVETPDRNYTVHDYEHFFRDIGFPDGWSIRKDTQGLVKDISAPGVEVHCLHGSDIRTPARFVYGKGYFPDYQPTMVPDDGDGTVNIRSLIACTKWKTEQKAKVAHEVFPGAEHMAMMNNKEILAYIDKLLTT